MYVIRYSDFFCFFEVGSCRRHFNLIVVSIWISTLIKFISFGFDSLLRSHKAAGADSENNCEDASDSKKNGKYERDGLRVSLTIIHVIRSHIVNIVLVNLVCNSVVSDRFQSSLYRCRRAIGNLDSTRSIEIVSRLVLGLLSKVSCVVLFRNWQHAFNNLKVDSDSARRRRK